MRKVTSTFRNAIFQEHHKHLYYCIFIYKHISTASLISGVFYNVSHLSPNHNTFHPFAPPKTTNLSPPHHSSAQHAPHTILPVSRAACESRCCHNSSAPGDPLGIFPAGIWPPAQKRTKVHPSHLAHPKEHREKKKQRKTGKIFKKVEPAIKNVWFWYMFWCHFFPL